MAQGNLADGRGVETTAGHVALFRKGVDDCDEGFAHGVGGAVQVGADRCKGRGKSPLQLTDGHRGLAVRLTAGEEIVIELATAERLEVAGEVGLHGGSDQHVVEMADRALAGLLLADIDAGLEGDGIGTGQYVADLQGDQIGDAKAGTEAEDQQAGFPVLEFAVEVVQKGLYLVIVLQGLGGHVLGVWHSEFFLPWSLMDACASQSGVSRVVGHSQFFLARGLGLVGDLRGRYTVGRDGLTVVADRLGRRRGLCPKEDTGHVASSLGVEIPLLSQVPCRCVHRESPCHVVGLWAHEYYTKKGRKKQGIFRCFSLCFEMFLVVICWWFFGAREWGAGQSRRDLVRSCSGK